MFDNELEMTDAAELTVEEINEVSGGWSWKRAAIGAGVGGAIGVRAGPLSGIIGAGGGAIIGGLTG